MNCCDTTAPLTPWDKSIQRGEPYPMNPGFRYLVLTYPRTRPYMTFLFPATSAGQALARRFATDFLQTRPRDFALVFR